MRPRFMEPRRWRFSKSSPSMPPIETFAGRLKWSAASPDADGPRGRNQSWATDPSTRPSPTLRRTDGALTRRAASLFNSAYWRIRARPTTARLLLTLSKRSLPHSGPLTCLKRKQHREKLKRHLRRASRTAVQSRGSIGATVEHEISGNSSLSQCFSSIRKSSNLRAARSATSTLPLGRKAVFTPNTAR